MSKVEDLVGMQNANLLNLPENYTFKYCEFRGQRLLDFYLYRPVSCAHLARTILRRC